MSAERILKITAAMILLFGIGHTAGYPWIGPVTPAQQQVLLDAFRSTVTVMQGFPRSYEDTHIGFGLYISLGFAIQAFLVWRMAGHVKDSPALVRLLAVAFGVQYLVTIVIDFRYLFWGPIVFSLLICAGFIASTVQLRARTQAARLGAG
jgi:hypothetical protein